MMIGYLLNAAEPQSVNHIQVRSHAFKDEQSIPIQYTCQGENRSFPIQWDNVPLSAKSLALIMSDPDAPSGIWYHWVLYNIPPDARGVREGEPYLLSPYEHIGKNSWGRATYEGPCPPAGFHRYQITVYALNTIISNNRTLTAQQLKQVMRGHILASGKLIGEFG